MNFLHRLAAAFFPPLCSCCRHPLLYHSGEKHICTPCLIAWPRPTYIDVADNRIARRFWGVFPIAAAASAFLYAPGGIMSPVIRKIKYLSQKNLCQYLGEIMALEPLPAELLHDADALIPVPLTPQRMRQRGYNQSAELCVGISRLTHLPVIEGVLQRKSFSSSQTQKSGNERAENVRGAFYLSDKQLLAGKHVVLVDDIMTTGATILECLMALRDVPDIKISILTLCQTTS